MKKFHAPLLFPNLGVSDDRRETKLASTPTERKTFFRAGAAQSVRENLVSPEAVQRVQENPAYKEGLTDDTYQRYMKMPVTGTTLEGLAGVGHPGYATDNYTRATTPGAGTGQSSLSAAFTPSAYPKSKKFGPLGAEFHQDPNALNTTATHEDLHRIFGRIQHLHGSEARSTLAANLMYALPKDLRTKVEAHLRWRRPDMEAAMRNGRRMMGEPNEEAITELHSYLSAPAQRDQFHRLRQDSPEQQREFHDHMKRAYRLLQAVSATANEGWLQRLRPWLKKGEASVAFHEVQATGLSAQQAHEVFRSSLKLSKAQPDLLDPNRFAFEYENNPALQTAISERHQELALRRAEPDFHVTLPHEQVFEPGEESAAKAMLGHRKEHERCLTAARFLVGRKEQVDEDMFRLALGVYDGDYERASLIAVGLSDSDKNLRALRAALKLGEFSPDLARELTKNEPGTPHLESVVAGAPDAVETAAEVARGATAGLVQPLVLGGKHSKGAMAVRDPKTGSVLLLKPGSGKQSPAAGARDDASSQSAREAAFWHCADKLGMGRYYPRADLLHVNGAEMAAMKLLGSQWKSLDERNRQVDGYAREVLAPYLKRGDVHRLAFLDGILANADSHGQNWMVHAEAVAGIDHGSAFAGPNFNPGKDSKSFTPYVLRVFGQSGYSKAKPEERVRTLPVLDRETDAGFRKWVQAIDPAVLVEVMSSHGIGDVAQKAVVARLDKLQRYSGASLSAQLNAQWAGTELWQ